MGRRLGSAQLGSRQRHHMAQLAASRKGLRQHVAGQCPGGPRGRCPGATQLNTQLYGYPLMKSGNLCMEWLRTVPSCGAACS